LDQKLNAGDATVDTEPNSTVETMMVHYTLTYNHVDVKKLKIMFNNHALNLTDKIMDVGICEGSSVNIGAKSDG
jgi:hypothetical protein